MTDVDGLFNGGVLTGEREGAVLPDRGFWNSKKNGLVIIECPQRIPCNPCHTSCPTGAIRPFADINDTPVVDPTLCTGCTLCVASCPGLACFVIDMTFSEDRALFKLPYELLPLPEKGSKVQCLNRTGEFIAFGTVENVTQPKKDRTFVVHVSAPKEIAGEFRTFRVVE